MSLNFTVEKIEEGFPDGQYKARIDHVENAHGDEKRGDHPIVRWTFLSPESFDGATFQKKYYVNHENDVTRKIARQELSKLCMEIGGLKEGEDPKESDLLYKVAILSIRKNKNGYSNIIGHTLVEGNSSPESQVLPTAVHDAEKTAAVLALSGIKTLNDEVPF